MSKAIGKDFDRAAFAIGEQMQKFNNLYLKSLKLCIL